ncbi:hypothetical protein [Glaciihabitans sp. UYNi722]|uniref:hypothetical protein n=1 Tax=Glaciihabitans sp. UYNi722 TaxID=3156344 RepID=UPI0033917E3D
MSDARLWVDDGGLTETINSTFGIASWPGMEGLSEFFDEWLIDGYEQWVSPHAGIVFVLENFDEFTRKNPTSADDLLNTVAEGCRQGALIGLRFLCLLTADDTGLWFRNYDSTKVWTYPFLSV